MENSKKYIQIRWEIDGRNDLYPRVTNDALFQVTFRGSTPAPKLHEEWRCEVMSRQNKGANVSFIEALTPRWEFVVQGPIFFGCQKAQAEYFVGERMITSSSGGDVLPRKPEHVVFEEETRNNAFEDAFRKARAIMSEAILSHEPNQAFYQIPIQVPGFSGELTSSVYGGHLTVGRHEELLRTWHFRPDSFKSHEKAYVVGETVFAHGFGLGSHKDPMIIDWEAAVESLGRPKSVELSRMGDFYVNWEFGPSSFKFRVSSEAAREASESAEGYLFLREEQRVAQEAREVRARDERRRHDFEAILQREKSLGAAVTSERGQTKPRIGPTTPEDLRAHFKGEKTTKKPGSTTFTDLQGRFNKKK